MPTIEPTVRRNALCCRTFRFTFAPIGVSAFGDRSSEIFVSCSSIEYRFGAM